MEQNTRSGLKLRNTRSGLKLRQQKGKRILPGFLLVEYFWPQLA
jgi:hypothetical protein